MSGSKFVFSMQVFDSETDEEAQSILTDSNGSNGFQESLDIGEIEPAVSETSAA